jgi:hypothetical protein
MADTVWTTGTRIKTTMQLWNFPAGTENKSFTWVPGEVAPDGKRYGAFGNVLDHGNSPDAIQRPFIISTQNVNGVKTTYITYSKHCLNSSDLPTYLVYIIEEF